MRQDFVDDLKTLKVLMKYLQNHFGGELVTSSDMWYTIAKFKHYAPHITKNTCLIAPEGYYFFENNGIPVRFAYEVWIEKMYQYASSGESVTEERDYVILTAKEIDVKDYIGRDWMYAFLGEKRVVAIGAGTLIVHRNREILPTREILNMKIIKIHEL
jgi:hypothetical protein